MNANHTPGLRVSCFALLIALMAPAVARAEVGVATQAGPGNPLAVYILDGLLKKHGSAISQIVADPATGLVVAAWSRNSASGFDVVVSRFIGGGWSTEQVVASSLANDLDPQLVLDPDGSVHLFYWVDGTTPQVFHVVAAPDLSSWSAPIAVSQPGQSACRPAGVFHDGVLHVAYEVHDFGYGNAPREVVIARFENGSFVPEVVAMTDNMGDVRPQVHSHAGRLWVDWIDAETNWGVGEMAWTRLSSSGHWEPIQYEPFGDREQRDYLTRGAARLKAIQ